jgi:hypothetical protein
MPRRSAFEPHATPKCAHRHHEQRCQTYLRCAWNDETRLAGRVRSSPILTASSIICYWNADNGDSAGVWRDRPVLDRLANLAENDVVDLVKREARRLDPLLPSRIGLANGREARESGLRLKG